VVAEASDGPEAVRLALELRPQVIVMDCALPEFNGIEATRRIRKDFPAVEILMLSMHSEETLVRQALEAGARGYVLKKRHGPRSCQRRKNRRGRQSDPGSTGFQSRVTQRRTRFGAHHARTRNSSTYRRRKIQQGNWPLI